MQAGGETTSNTINFTIKLLAAYPFVQEKMYQEILQVIGKDRLPNIADKQK